MKKREAKIVRKTSETDIEAFINIDGSGKYSVETGIGFFDHMLSLFARHGLIDLNIKAKGDTFVDCHHTVEDVGIVLGQCINKSLGSKEGIKRYGTSFVPMDESLALVSVDLSGRPYLFFDCDFTVDKLGDFDIEMTEEFFRAFAFNSFMTMHGKIIHGKNNHHMAEALFKALGRAFREAASYDEKIEGVNSTKGILQ